MRLQQTNSNPLNQEDKTMAEQLSQLCGVIPCSDDERRSLAATSLLLRAALYPAKLAYMIRESKQPDADKAKRASQLLENLVEFVDEEAPDPFWWRDYFVLTGEHMVLTEEGWEPGECKAAYLDDDPKWEPLDEVNALKDGREVRAEGNNADE
jgi:hypothetical protein